MRRVILAGAIALMVAAPTSATAAPLTPALLHDYQLANRYWGGPPVNCTSLDMGIVYNDELPKYVLAAATEATYPQPCELWIARELVKPVWALEACVVMLHEVGHLHGLGHSSNPEDVMYVEPTTNVPAICKRGNR